MGRRCPIQPKQNSMSYNAILFDLDGTLLDSLEDLGDAVNRVLTARGLPGHSLDSYRYFVGDGSAMLIKRALPEDQRNDDIIRICLDAYLRDYSRNWQVKTKPVLQPYSIHWERSALHHGRL